MEIASNPNEIRISHALRLCKHCESRIVLRLIRQSDHGTESLIIFFDTDENEIEIVDEQREVHFVFFIYFFVRDLNCCSKSYQ